MILEKQVEAQQEILQFFESNTQKLELRQQESAWLREIILSHELRIPYDLHIQYADIFSSVDKFRSFFQGSEKMLEKHKLWLGLKVRHHILRMQAYFASINAMLVSFNRIPLPDGVELSEEDFTKLGDKLLLFLGAVIDEEFNYLVMDLEVMMVDSSYKLDLSRSKYGLFSKRYASKEVKRVEKYLYEESLLGEYFRIMPILIFQLLQAYKEIEITEEDAVAYYKRVSTTSMEDRPRSFI
ncbi:MAG: hypothetical protein IBX55_18550 [Methyloprofundus sp.]|nr:hypothetical protein [Methyloprofundus sp.]